MPRRPKPTAPSTVLLLRTTALLLLGVISACHSTKVVALGISPHPSPRAMQRSVSSMCRTARSARTCSRHRQCLLPPPRLPPSPSKLSSLCEAQDPYASAPSKATDAPIATDRRVVATDPLLGPPARLAHLAVGESAGNIVRLSRNPDIFLMKGFLPNERDRSVLTGIGNSAGRMKLAGTNKSEQNTVRKHSYLAWIDPHSITSAGSYIDSHDETTLARSMCRRAREHFISDILQKQHHDGRLDYCWTEDLQVAMYRPGGRFDYHHDGNGRFLTVLCYVNGVGGTYFPFANPGEEGVSVVDFCDNERLATDVAAATKRPGEDGMLLVGKEGIGAYCLCKDLCQKSSIVEIEAGDAVAFYSYNGAGSSASTIAAGGSRDWKSLHASLTVPEEKFISTCWFRSEALTGPFGWLHRQALLETETTMMRDAPKQL